jgi:hypothetical protein
LAGCTRGRELREAKASNTCTRPKSPGPGPYGP